MILQHECAILQKVNDYYNIYFILKQYFRHHLSKTEMSSFQSPLTLRLPIRILIKSDKYVQRFKFKKTSQVD